MNNSPESGTLGAAAMIIVVMNRWDDDFALYRDYIDHARHTVIYLTTAAGRRAVPAELARAVVELEPSYTEAHLLAHCRKIVADFGPIDRIIALSEYDLPKAAFLRAELAVPGVGPAQALLFTDKVAMKRAIARAGLRAPLYVECGEVGAVAAFAAGRSYPLILKPKVGAASRGVHAALSRTALLQLLASIDLSDYECEEYIPGTVLHVDGIVCGGHIGLIVASRYINNCLAFNSGVPLGSVFIDDAALNARIAQFTAQVLDTLALADGAFHLEVIHSESDQLVFLELNARVGGAEITFLMRDLFGIDLVGVWVGLQVDGQLRLPPPEERAGTVGGWLLIPEPDQIPCEVVRCEPLGAAVPYLYKEILPAVGHVFRGDGGYENIAGRFRFNGPSSAAVEQAIYGVLTTFDIELRGAAH